MRRLQAHGTLFVYQCGGAFGFRDQLQDAVNMILFDPAIARRRILDCCATSIQKATSCTGGTRRKAATRAFGPCSDDLLWLPWAVCEYVDKTGDTALLEERVSFLVSPVLETCERSRYETPRASEAAESVVSHAARAVALAAERGPARHGLRLMGGGDWNDG
jgi:cellobiose phosphorylase